MSEKKLVFQNGSEIEFSPGATTEKLRGYTPPLIWEDMLTEEEWQTMLSHSMRNNERKGLPLEIHSTPKGQSWYYAWWQNKDNERDGRPLDE